MCKSRAFTLIELLVVIAVIAVLMSILMPALRTARRIASSSVCLANQKSLLTGWVLYADDNNGSLINSRALYDTANYKTPWVHRPKDAAGNSLSSPPPATITKEDRIRGIQAGTMWPYVPNANAYHCPGDNRWRMQQPPRDAWRSYSISYAFCHSQQGNFGYRPYRRMSEVRNVSLYYVFVEEEHNASRYGENEGGWDLRMSATGSRGVNDPASPDTWTLYDPLASYHNKSSTFGFADGHAQRITWRDERTLEAIERNKHQPGSHSWIDIKSPGNEDIKWLIDHFIERRRVER